MENILFQLEKGEDVDTADSQKTSTGVEAGYGISLNNLCGVNLITNRGPVKI